ncbi:polymorphic toxin type 17 domain-containing protein [Streptomyces sp. NPDC051014]|uniref:polymorphic toxin type 17 domain-containing protein n=1 Tax=Streptomyces sp. NPDC051014 TaxID=3155751 RepID=UPI0033FCD406
MKQDDELAVLRPELRNDKRVRWAAQAAAKRTATQRKSAGTGTVSTPSLRAADEAAVAATEDDADFEGALWGATYIVADESQLDPAGVVTNLPSSPPVSAQLYPSYQPGQTTWYVEANWSQTAAPRMLRIDLYRASDNTLVATRLTSSDTTKSAETTSLCLGWSLGSSAPKTCVWSLKDGVLDGNAGTAYYAKLSFATQMTNHFYKVPDQAQLTYREYYLPTAWTAAITSPAGPAVYTAGVDEGLSGWCTCFYQTRIADPVNTATGAVTETVTDTVVPGKGQPLTLSRSYSSTATDTGGLLGRGWRLPFESRLTVGSDTVTLTDTDGASVAFTKDSSGDYQAPAPVRYELITTGDGYRVTGADHTSRDFDGTGRLTRWSDGAGEGLSFGYSGSTLSTITDAVGRVSTLDVDASTGRLDSVLLADGRSVHYAYTDGQLSAVTGTDGGVTGYTYSDGRLATVVDPKGNTVTQNTYDPSTGRIKEQVDASGGTYKFTWTPTADAPAGSGESDMTAPGGGIWTDVYQAGVLLRSYRPEGGEAQRGYDQVLNVTSEYDSNFNRTLRTFDARGNIATEQQGGVTQSYDFDSLDRLTTYTNGRGFTISYEYEGDTDRVKTVQGPQGTTAYTYTADGQVETATAPGGGVTRYAYDSNGLLSALTDPDKGKTTYTYDAAGRLKSTTDPRGNVEGADPEPYTTHYEYDGAGRLWKVTDPEDHTTTYTYDDNGNVKTVTDALDRVTAYEYNPANQLTKVTDPDSKSSTQEYDDRGNLTAQTDETGRRTTYGYDGAGRLSSTTTPRGNVDGADPSAYTTTYGYDDNGNLTDTVDPLGSLTTTEYDALNRPYQVTDAMEHVTKTEYDENGNVTKVTDPRGKATTYTYTDDDLLKTQTDPRGKTTHYDYDTARNPSNVTTPSGAMTSWVYDDAGRMSTSTDPRGNVEGADPDLYTTHYDYDAAGNLTKVTDPLGHAESYGYDALGRQNLTTDARTKSTSTAYDAIGRIKSVTAPDDGVTSYTYDTAGNVDTRVDDNQHTTHYTYDDAHRLKSVTDPLNRTVSYDYDADGNRKTVTNARGVTATTAYDALGEPTSTTYSDDTPDVGIVYDAAGNRHEVTDGTGTRTLTYDEDDQLKTVSVPGSSSGFTYSYDDAGNLESRTLPDGLTTTYTYDDDGRRHTDTTGGATITYGYDAAGNLISSALPSANGYTDTRTYDHAGLLASLTTADGDSTLASWTVQRDATGQPTQLDSVRNGQAQPPQYYGYDDVGRLASWCTSATGTTDCPSGSAVVTYGYDKVGNRTTMEKGGKTTTYSYDAADELTQATTGTVRQVYKYDADGNYTGNGSTASTVTYDANNQPIAATQAGQHYTFVNDDQGNRVSTRLGDDLVRTDTWDVSSGLPQLATSTDGSGNLIGDYTTDPQDRPQSIHTGDDVSYIHQDPFGSATELTGSDGTPQQQYSYDPFGNVTATTDDATAPDNPFGFAGQLNDQTLTGKQDLRARTYDPAIGRFTSQDPYDPGQETAYTQPYAYVENMPTSRTDPSGMCSVTTQLKDFFTGNYGWNNNCAKEDRDTATKPPAVQAAKNFSDKATEGLINTTGQASLGFLDGLTFGTFGYLSGAQVTCPTAYNYGLYASMVPFPIEGGGKRLAAEGAEVLGRDVVQTGMKGLIKKAQLPFRGRIRYVPPAGTSVSAGLPRAPRGGFIDKFGNIWVKGPSRTPGEAFEWDVQLSRQGRAQLGWASRDGSHLNVSLNGRITHK